MKQLDYIVNSEKEILSFLKSQYPIYHMSNIFFRDIQYGIQKMFERKNVKTSYADAEKIAKAFVAQLERKKILVRIDGQSWVVHYPEFKKSAAKPAAPAKPAASAAAVPRPAGAAPAPPRPPAAPGTLPPLKSGTPAAARPAGTPPILPPLMSATPAAPKPAAPALPPLKSSAPAAKPATAVGVPPAEAPADKGPEEQQA